MKFLDITKLRENIEKRAEYNLSNCNIDAACVYVSQNGKEVYRNVFGKQTQVNSEPVTSKTLFRLASMTKPVTSIAIGILVDKGLISLNDTVEKYLPIFSDLNIRILDQNRKDKILGKAKTKPTILHLLTHTSGIGSDEIGKEFEEDVHNALI